VLSADILQKVASSFKNAKVSIFHRKSAENASLYAAALGEILLNMTSVHMINNFIVEFPQPLFFILILLIS
jgi:hypothetical protein